jgi:hypothetical protein
MSDKIHRRHLLAGGIAFVGTGLVSGTAAAFPPNARDDFREATKILRRYGLRITGETTAGHDDIHLAAFPIRDTQYTHTVNLPTSSGAMEPCFKTAYFDDDAVFTHFHESETGSLDPCVKTSILGHGFGLHEIFDHGSPDPYVAVGTEMLEGGHIGQVDFTHFHGSLDPCVRTTLVDHGLAVHEIFDHSLDPCVRVTAEMLADGGIGTIGFTHLHEGSLDPCVRTTIEEHSLATTEVFGGPRGARQVTLAADMLDGGVIDRIALAIERLDANLTITVGARTYELRDGALVEV